MGLNFSLLMQDVILIPVQSLFERYGCHIGIQIMSIDHSTTRHKTSYFHVVYNDSSKSWNDIKVTSLAWFHDFTVSLNYEENKSVKQKYYGASQLHCEVYQKSSF